MQIEEKYQKDYQQALLQIREERARFVGELSKIEGIRVIPSQANYVMLELTSGISAKALTRNLLIGHNLFIKDLSGKIAAKKGSLCVWLLETHRKMID